MTPRRSESKPAGGQPFAAPVNDPVRPSDALTLEQLLAMYERMKLIRAFEEAVVQLYVAGEVRGSFHPSIGQEATAVGGCFALAPDDYMTCTYRGHNACIAKGIDVNAAMAEMLGKRAGVSKGKGGSMHWTEPAIGLLGENAIVGAGVPIAAGAALTAQLDRSGRVALAYFGDGAINQGMFLETLNLAQLWKLPLILVCENNLYAEMTPLDRSNPHQSIAERAAGFAMRAVTVDGNDVLAMYDAVAEARARALAGEGPTFIEALTYRYLGHMIGDPETYRTKEEVAEWKKRDPIARLRQHLFEKHGVSEGQFAAIDERVAQRVADAVAFAKQAALPTPDEVWDDVWA
ncbi:MAG: thiamine pyrophosphate-dependent dehydrogenase E1 component subunit alpha [Anaerolineae bacterium]|nr:thiamine pyrophosphate-dependent dehydrogenase E1 component subunit alpha [Thermoflexales bacterium]MDW8408092.1 thiamine pyrophosphate-dependent dehydrogenase E1 component subunit alpha [Anaerolineae bacterium]